MKEYDFNFKDIVESARDVIIVTRASPLDEPGPEIVYVNKAFTDLTGYTPKEVIGKSPRILQSSGTDDESKAIIRQGLEQQVPVRTSIRNYSKTGEAYWLDISILPLRNKEGVVTHFVAIERDITNQKNIQERLELLSKTDPLTELLNRRAFDERAKNEFSRFKRNNNEVYALLMIDLDHFKEVNDAHGHAVGDDVLKGVSQLCKSHLRMHDVVARIGGEEFCVLLPDTYKQTAYNIAEKLRELIAGTPIRTSAGEISMTISIGVSVVQAEDTDETSVFQRADESLYKAKKAGRNRVFK